MKKKLFSIGIIFFFVINSTWSKVSYSKETLVNLLTVLSVENMDDLYNLNNVFDGDIILVEGFRNKNDGGGGFFIFDSQSSLNPVFDDSNYFKVGYNPNYDGMVVKSKNNTGRWIRQWNRGNLNIRWFGGTPGNSTDCSYALMQL